LGIAEAGAAAERLATASAAANTNVRILVSLIIEDLPLN
jgi:hypothetical protein